MPTVIVGTESLEVILYLFFHVFKYTFILIKKTDMITVFLQTVLRRLVTTFETLNFGTLSFKILLRYADLPCGCNSSAMYRSC